jgi:RNA 3'-terminal phosphate cyclase
MSDAEIGAMVREALDSDGVLATLSIRRGHDPDGGGAFTVQLHVYEEHASRPELGNVRGGHHQTTRGQTLGEALSKVTT